MFPKLSSKSKSKLRAAIAARSDYRGIDACRSIDGLTTIVAREVGAHGGAHARHNSIWQQQYNDADMEEVFTAKERVALLQGEAVMRHCARTDITTVFVSATALALNALKL